MDEFVTELEKLRRDHATEFDGVPMEYSPALCVRIVDYVRGEQRRGHSVLQLAARLQIPVALLKKWLYVQYRNRESTPQFSTGVMRPVQVRAKVVQVFDGTVERRFSIRSRKGWCVRDLTLEELTSLLRSLH